MTSITVVKLGGSTLGQHDTSLDDIVALHKEGRRLVVVHGGGATISQWLDRAGVASKFVRGLRATDAAALEIVVAVLAGLVNKQLVAELQARGADAIGLSGADGALLRARRYDPELGFVGEITEVDAASLSSMAEHVIVVLAPIALEGGAVHPEPVEGQLLNVNADTAAGDVAVALQAERLVFLTDVPGVKDASGAVQAMLGPKAAKDLIDSGAVAGGMAPKVEAGLRAAAAGVETRIVDGREEGALRRVVAGEAVGTRIS
jgi:acetylglutamate kinase